MPIPSSVSRQEAPPIREGGAPGGTGLSRGVVAGIAALIFVWVFAAFGPALDAGFVDFDDGILLVENTRYRGLGAEQIAWAFNATPMGHYQPLTWLSYSLDYVLAGSKLAAGQVHLTNLVLHAAGAAVLFLVALRLLTLAGVGCERAWAPAAGAAAAALLWGLHPLRVESVAWATERRDVLSGLFWVAAIWAYLRSVRPGEAALASVPFYAASIVLLTLSLLSKAWGMSFFLIAMILDWYPLRRLPMNPKEWVKPAARAVLLQKAPFVLLGLACAIVAGKAQDFTGATRSLAEWDVPSRLAQALHGLVWYPAKTIWPTRLAALYELPKSLDPLSAKSLLCGAIVLAGAGAVWALRHRAPALLAAAAAYAVIIAPVLGFRQAGDQLMADRYSYLAVIGLIVAAGGGLSWLAARAGRPDRRAAAGVAAVAVLAALSVLTWRQTAVWKDALTLWAHAARVRPGSMMAHVNYGTNLNAAGRADEAIEQFREATRLRPDDGRGWYPLAHALRRRGDLAGAEHAYRESAKYLPQAYQPLVNLGNLLTNELGRPDEGLAAYRAAVDAVENLRPGSRFHPGPYLSLGAALKKRGELEEARRMLERAAETAGKYTEVREQALGHLRQMGAAPPLAPAGK